MLNSMQAACLNSGQEIPAKKPFNTAKAERRRLRAQGRKMREENPVEFSRNRWKDRQSRPGCTRH